MGVSLDPITDFLSAIRTEGVFYGRIEVSAPWAPLSDTGLRAGFCLISHGQASLGLADGAGPLQLSQGDFFLVAPGREYVLSSGDVAPASILAGHFNFDEAMGRLLAKFFPPLILIRGGQPQMLPLQQTLELLAAEVDSSTTGSEMAVRRLADLLLIQALRSHMASAPEESAGWLLAFSDSQIGAALNSMHERIDHPWTVASLASEAGMSRSAFAQRFKQLMSESPLEYLTRWRMYRGTSLLRESDRKLADVAQAVGYDSDGAFHKAFKRVLGVAPGEYRRAASH
ncbi:MAG TPA: AraC family transcriptional regulator [Bryobacteraceae bacterium]|nr:AraC family transcriptional regulator [Bryobacteraceae bacterium]